jgi:hypothetical protein
MRFTVSGHKLSQYFQRRFLISTFRNTTIKDGSFKVNGSPEIEIIAINLDEDFIDVPSPVRGI